MNPVPATKAMELCRGYDEGLETFELVMKLERHLFPLLAERAAEALKDQEDDE